MSFDVEAILERWRSVTEPGTPEPGRGFFRAAAVLAILAALGVLVAQLGLTGYAAPRAAEETVLLYVDPIFRAQAWVVLVQVFVMFLVLWATTVKAWRMAPAFVFTAFLFVLLWQVLEILPRSIELFALSYGWAPDYLASEDPTRRSSLLEMMRGTGTVVGALGSSRRTLWMLAHLTFGVTLWRGPRLTRAIGFLFLLNAVRLLLRLTGEATGWSWPGTLSGGLAGFVVTIVPLFVLIGWWLWREPVPLEKEGRRATLPKTGG